MLQTGQLVSERQLSWISWLMSGWVRELPRFSRCELLWKAVAETGNSSGTQRKWNVRRGKPLPRDGGEDVTMDTNACVCVCVCVCNSELYKVWPYSVLKSPINPVVNPKPVYSPSYTWQYIDSALLTLFRGFLDPLESAYHWSTTNWDGIYRQPQHQMSSFSYLF
jgi:hypothetical protein